MVNVNRSISTIADKFFFSIDFLTIYKFALNFIQQFEHTLALFQGVLFLTPFYMYILSKTWLLTIWCPYPNFKRRKVWNIHKSWKLFQGQSRTQVHYNLWERLLAGIPIRIKFILDLCSAIATYQKWTNSLILRKICSCWYCSLRQTSEARWGRRSERAHSLTARYSRPCPYDPAWF